jgi:hypothetical protein
MKFTHIIQTATARKVGKCLASIALYSGHQDIQPLSILLHIYCLFNDAHVILVYTVLDDKMISKQEVQGTIILLLSFQLVGWPGELLLGIASTANLGIESLREPRPYFCSLRDFLRVLKCSFLFDKRNF